MVEVKAESREILIDKARTFIDQLQSTRGFRITEAYLYGSQARDGADADSDIDVAVISPDLSGNRADDWFMLNKIASKIDVRLEVVGFRPEQFRDENPLVWEVKKGVKLI